MSLRISILLCLITINNMAQRNWFCHTFEIRKQSCLDTVNYKQKKYSDVRPEKFSNQKLFLYQNKKCKDTVFTDEHGRLCLKLKKGVYELYLPYKHYKKVPFTNEQGFDKVCLENEQKKPDAIIKKKFRGNVLVNHRIGYMYCPTKHPCSNSINTQEIQTIQD